MTRGNDTQTKVHYKGKEDDFVVFVDSVNALKEWKEDKTKPLADVVSGWKVFVSHKCVALLFFFVVFFLLSGSSVRARTEAC